MMHRWIGLLFVVLLFSAVRAQNGYPPEVDVALADVNARMGTNYRLGNLVNWYWEERVFPDASMGCPARGVEYAQVETPGFAIFLTLGNQLFEYRAEVRSGTAIFCSMRPAPRVPTPSNVRPTRTPGNWEYIAARGTFNPYLAWSPAGAAVAVAGADGGESNSGVILLYNPDDLAIPPTQIPFNQPVTALDYGANAAGVYLVTGGAGGAISFLPVEPEGATSVAMQADTITGRVTVVSSSPDGSVIASANEAANAIQLWNATTGEPLRSIETSAAITALDFSATGTLLAAGLASGRLLLVDYGAGTIISEIGQSDEVTDAALTVVGFSPDASRLAVATGTRITVWDVTDPENLAMAQTITTDIPIRTLAFSPDGSRIAAAGGSLDAQSVVTSVIRLWDVASGENTATLRAHTGAVNSIAFSPDGTRLASVSYDATLRVWRFGPMN